jgi:hypothetical protein
MSCKELFSLKANICNITRLPNVNRQSESTDLIMLNFVLGILLDTVFTFVPSDDTLLIEATLLLGKLF